MNVAMRIGNTVLLAEDGSGADRLMKDIKESVFPLMKEEADDVYREFHKDGGGILSRQEGESVMEFCARRERAYTLLKGLDPKVDIDDVRLGKMVLENGGLTAEQILY